MYEWQASLNYNLTFTKLYGGYVSLHTYAHVRTGTWTCPEYLSPPRGAFVLRVSGMGMGRGYGLRFYILTRVRLTWFPLHEGDRFDLVCLLNTAGLYQVLAKSYGGISRIICVLKKFDRSGGRVNFRNISFVVNFESEVAWIRFGGRNFQRCLIPILLFLFQVRFKFDCHSTLEYIYIYR